MDTDGPPANGSYKLEQISPCAWRFSDVNTEVTLRWSLDGTELTIERSSQLHLESADSAACLIAGNSDFQDSARNFALGNYQLFL